MVTYPPEALPEILPGTILLGLTGSRAYGLEKSDGSSDYDWKGVYQAPTSTIVSLSRPKETIVKHDPDLQLHELGRFIELAIKCNPTLMELLWLEDYAVLTDAGQQLVDIRKSFLWTKRAQGAFFGQVQQKIKLLKQLEPGGNPLQQLLAVRELDKREGVRDSYFNYAKDQFNRIVDRDGTYKSKLAKRTEKHTRHLFRLLDQGRQLLETGELTVRVADPQRLWDLCALPLEEMIVEAEAELATFRDLKSVLPDHPDSDTINKLLVNLRLAEIKER